MAPGCRRVNGRPGSVTLEPREFWNLTDQDAGGKQQRQNRPADGRAFVPPNFRAIASQ